MVEDEQLQTMITQTIELAITQKDAYLKEIETSNDILKIISGSRNDILVFFKSLKFEL